MSVEKTRIYPINTGWVTLDHATYLFLKGTPGKKVPIPNTCFYVDTGEHKLMVDTGLPDSERASQYHHDCDKRGCPDSPTALRAMGVDPDDIEICIFTHLHWDHCSNMKVFRNARYITSSTELAFAHNPLPLYYRSYEAPILGIQASFVGCQFELADHVVNVVPGVTIFPTPGHTPGHLSVQVETTAGNAVIVGDAILRYRNFEPRTEEHWHYWVQQRFVDMIAGWCSMEEIDRRADFILPYHDELVLEHPVYPYPDMPLRRRREAIAGAPFYFSGI